MINFNDFVDDLDKVKDLLYLSKEEFLKTYSYIDEVEYENTVKKIYSYVSTRKNGRENLKEKRNENIEETRKYNLDYYYKNRDKINARRKQLRDERRRAGLI